VIIVDLKLKQLAAYAWLLAVSIAYFSLFPFTEIVAGLSSITSFKLHISSIEHLFCLVLFITAANGLASFLFFKTSMSNPERFLFATAAGFGVISLAVLLLDVLGVTLSPLYFFILIAGFILSIVSCKKTRNRLSSHFGALLLISAAPLVSTLVGALAPPTQFDSLVYHLALPARYLLAGKMFAVPCNFFFSFPQGMEMIYQMAIKLDGAILANLLHWIFLPLVAYAVFEFCKRFWDPETGVLASTIWLLTPAAMLVSTGTYVDLAVAFYVFAGVYSFVLWEEFGSSRFLYLCSLFSGLACGVKYTAFINVFILGLFFLFSNRHRWTGATVSRAAAAGAPEEPGEGFRSSPRPAFSSAQKNAATFLAIVLLVFSPWLLKNFIFLKNPVSPWGTGLFSSSTVTKEQAGSYFSHIASHGVNGGGFKELLLLPFSVTFSGFKFGGAFDILGPVFLLFIPILFLRMKIDRIEKNLLLYSLIYAVIWVFSGKVMRFLLPVIPFLCIFSARGVMYLGGAEHGRTLRNAVIVFLALILAHNFMLYHWVMARVDPYSVLFGGLTEKQYLSKKINYFAAAATQLNSLGSGTKTLFLGETRSYYCTGNVVVPTVFDTNPLIAQANASRSPEDLRRFMKANDFTHIFLNDFEFERLSFKTRFTADGLEIWTGFRNRCTKLIYKDRFCELYEITY